MGKHSLDEFLERNRIWYRIITKKETIHTADAANAAEVELQRLTKNLVSVTDHSENVLLIVPGDRKVNLKAAANALGVGNVHLVSFAEAEKISGFPAGGTPSIGHKMRMRTVIDKTLLQHNTIYCGGGSRDRLLELKTKDIIKLNDAIIADILSKADSRR